MPAKPAEDAVDIAQALAEGARAIGRMEARLLLSHVTGMSASAIAAHPESGLTSEQTTAWRGLVARRAAGVPIAYLVGTREFFGHDFFVTPDVLIPRPETELLVELGLAKVPDLAAPTVLDLGCGSACIAISLALARPAARVTAVDQSSAALAVARRNAAHLGAALHLVESDWYDALATGGDARFDLIVSNPPYIPAADPHLAQGDLRFEPRTALASGADGLTAIRAIIDGAPAHLKSGGWLLIEHGYDQAAALLELLRAGGFEQIEQHRDLAGIVRVSGGRWGTG